MKITKLTTFVVPPRWLFLKVETDEGVTGWGEPVVEGRALTVEAAVKELGDYLIGKDPRLIEDHWTVMHRGGFYRGGPILMSAIAGIDQALWDIKGKALGVPVHELLDRVVHLRRGLDVARVLAAELRAGLECGEPRGDARADRGHGARVRVDAHLRARRPAE